VNGFVLVPLSCISMICIIHHDIATIFQVRVVPAKHIMKCDDDTFVRIESVLDQVNKVQSGKSIYVGNINYYHRPLRSGKWSVTYEVRLYFLCTVLKSCQPVTCSLCRSLKRLKETLSDDHPLMLGYRISIISVC
jgi:hypothetical protein